jgi:hypothetical protein
LRDGDSRDETTRLVQSVLLDPVLVDLKTESWRLQWFDDPAILDVDVLLVRNVGAGDEPTGVVDVLGVDGELDQRARGIGGSDVEARRVVDDRPERVRDEPLVVRLTQLRDGVGGGNPADEVERGLVDL